VALGASSQGKPWPLPPGKYVVHYLLTDAYSSVGSARFTVTRQAGWERLARRRGTTARGALVGVEGAGCTGTPGMLGSVKTSETMNAEPIGRASLVVAAGDGPDC